MKRSAMPRRRRPLRARSDRQVANDVQLAAAKAIVRERSGGRCELDERRFDHRCQGRGMQFHHVQRRSQGGSNDPTNLLHVCTNGHTRIHAEPAAARVAGLLIVPVTSVRPFGAPSGGKSAA